MESLGVQQVLQQFGDVELFLTRHEDIGPATRTKLLDVLHGPQLNPLKVELAAAVDIGSYFVKGTYNLEGDGILAVKCYEEILKIRNAINAKYYVSQSSSSLSGCLSWKLSTATAANRLWHFMCTAWLALLSRQVWNRYCSSSVDLQGSKAVQPYYYYRGAAYSY